MGSGHNTRKRPPKELPRRQHNHCSNHERAFFADHRSIFTFLSEVVNNRAKYKSIVYKLKNPDGINLALETILDDKPPVNEQKRIGTTMIVVMWVLLLVLLAFFFDDVFDRQHNPNQALSTRYIGDNLREVVLQRNRYGHYVTDGKINGQPVVFMLDTGATGVAIPKHIAQQLNLERGHRFETQTANGIDTVNATRLRNASVGEIEKNDISAVIIPNYEADEVLLGMSFLKHIEFSQRGNTLILRQFVR